MLTPAPAMSEGLTLKYSPSNGASVDYTRCGAAPTAAYNQGRVGGRSPPVEAQPPVGPPAPPEFRLPFANLRVLQGATFRSLRHRNARAYFLGLLVSSVGTWLQLTATTLLLYQLTGKAEDLGLNAAAQFLPMLLLGAWAGGLADRVDRRRLMLATQSAMALQAFALAALVAADRASPTLVYVLSALLGIIGAIDNPARRGLIAELVEADDVPNAMALNTAVMTGSRILGPAIAATLAQPLGIPWLLAANGLSFAAFILPVAAIRPGSLRVEPKAAAGGQPVREALRFVAGHPQLGPLMLVYALVSTFAFNHSVSLPALAERRFGDAQAFGYLLSVTGIGSLVGALVTAGRQAVSPRWFLSCTALLGLASLAMAAAPSMAWALALALPLGLGGAGFISAANAILQGLGPPEMRSRLLALTAVAFLGSTPIGGPITGWIADHVSPGWSLAYGGLVSLAAAAWMVWRLGLGAAKAGGG